MKKIISGFFILISLLFVVGCNDNSSPDDDSEKTETDHTDNVDTVNGTDIIEKIDVNSNYISEAESFYDVDNDYYIFTMGTIANVPLEPPTFFYYGGKGELEQTFTKTVTSVSNISTTVQRVVQERMSWELSSEIGASIKADLGRTIKSSISSKISGKESSEYTTTESDSYSEFMEWAKSLQNSVTIKFDERYQAGYYTYLISATVKVRAVLVKSKTTGTVSVGTYNELLSFGYSFAYNKFDDKLIVDKNQKFEFDLPDVKSLPTPKEFFDIKKEYTPITNTQGFNEINGNLNGKYVILDDLDFYGTQITPIGGSNKKFSGVIKGCGHTIKNFSVSANYPFAGLIAHNNGSIENLHVRNANISASCTAADAAVGVITGENTGTISYCSVSNSSAEVRAVDSKNTENSSRYSIAGGIAGKISAGEIKYCSVEGTSLYGYVKKHDKAWSEGWNEVAFVYIGGIVGEQLGGNVLNNTTRSLTKIEGYAEYRANALISAATRSRICLGGIIGRRANSGLAQSGNTSTVSESSFKHTFNSYNEINGVKPIEQYYHDGKVGYTDD